jgi:hypothetical protein
VSARNPQARTPFGKGGRRIATIPQSTEAATTNRMPAKLTGGRSARPSLMKSHVELQIRDRTHQTRTASGTEEV